MQRSHGLVKLGVGVNIIPEGENYSYRTHEIIINIAPKSSQNCVNKPRVYVNKITHCFVFVLTKEIYSS